MTPNEISDEQLEAWERLSSEKPGSVFDWMQVSRKLLNEAVPQLIQALREARRECVARDAFIDRFSYLAETIIEIYDQQTPENRPVKPVIMNRELMRKLAAMCTEEIVIEAEKRQLKKVSQ